MTWSSCSVLIYSFILLQTSLTSAFVIPGLEIPLFAFPASDSCVSTELLPSDVGLDSSVDL